MSPSAGPWRATPSPSIARGMAVAVALAALAVAARPFVEDAPAPAATPWPACTRPVEISSGAGTRVACGDDAALASCAELAAGDRVVLEGGRCRREVAGMGAAARIVHRLKIDVNGATAEELAMLEGIGPRLARAIVDYRDDNGAFDSIEDLHRVRGVGPATLAALRDQLEARDRDPP